MTPEQQAFVAQPWDYVGLTVPTYQDRDHLITKGYIYIGADQGELKMRGEIADDPWGRFNGNALLGVLFHEIGHVFGFQHDSAHRLRMMMMGEKIPELLVVNDDRTSKPGEYHNSFMTHIPNFIQQQSIENVQTRIQVPLVAGDRELLQLRRGENYLEMIAEPLEQEAGAMLDIKFYAGSCFGRAWGERPENLRLIMAGQEFTGQYVGYASALYGSLPPEQQVFDEANFSAFSILNRRRIDIRMAVTGGQVFEGRIKLGLHEAEFLWAKDGLVKHFATWPEFFTGVSRMNSPPYYPGYGCWFGVVPE